MINFNANWENCQKSWETSLILSLRKYLLHLMGTLKFVYEFVKSDVTDVFSALVQQAVTDITTKVKVVKIPWNRLQWI